MPVAIGLTFGMRILKKTWSIKNILSIKTLIVSTITCNTSTNSVAAVPHYTVTINILLLHLKRSYLVLIL